MPTPIGSIEHKQEVCETLIRTYQENIWKDEIYLLTLGETRGEKRKQIADIDLKLERKEFKTKNEGEKAKFVAERELAAIDKEIAAITEQVKGLWPARIEMVKRYMA